MFIASNSGRVSYGVKRLILDTATELADLDTKNLYTGSTAFIIESSETYMLNSKKEWKKVNLGTNSGGGGGGTGDETIYEGGVEV